ncbi:MAG: hypothetical protein ACKVKT_09040 [Rhodospirillales bacterium]
MSGVTPLEIVERAVTVLRNINAFDGVTVSELAKLSDVPRAFFSFLAVPSEMTGSLPMYGRTLLKPAKRSDGLSASQRFEIADSTSWKAPILNRP